MRSLRSMGLAVLALIAAPAPAIAGDFYALLSGAQTEQGDGLRWGHGLGWRHAQGFGVEASWQRLSELEATSTSIMFGSAGPITTVQVERTEGESLAAFLTYRGQWGDSPWSFGMKVGLHRWTYEFEPPSALGFDPDVVSHGQRYRIDGHDRAFGLDVRYALNEHWAVGIAVERYNLPRGGLSRVGGQLVWTF